MESFCFWQFGVNCRNSLLQVVLDDSDPNDQSFLRHTGEPLYVAAWFLRAYATVHTAAKADEGDCEVCELRRPDLCHTGSYRDGYARNAFMFFFLKIFAWIENLVLRRGDS